ncbi:Death-associated protein-like 1-A [Liparis tanakae]|uniref:Death-associated protein-like 1-A n=1 Tax=Liparis tanakae TaxID=230148 RepID=A0A4Z2J4X7_9TELE|nr:Death-associated protein-like 1-A [Liparis tanakae]
MVQQISKSRARETPLLKAGHPPAVKAGGKRVAKKSFDDSGSHGIPDKETKRTDKLSRSLRMQPVSILLAGTLDKLSHNFPETPVSVRHSKVRPALEKSYSHRNFVIQQPQKF